LHPQPYGYTGLGLAISKRLMEIMGGRTWAESRPGLGSTFYFTVVMDGASTIPDKAINAGPESSIEFKPDKDLRILLAEEKLVNQRRTHLMLKRLCYKADAVADGIEVLQALER
jgi:hypothetical protein